MMMVATPFLPIIGHQYGWDEIAMFLVPIVLAVVGVRFAEKRAAEKKRLAEAGDGDGSAVADSHDD